MTNANRVALVLSLLVVSYAAPPRLVAQEVPHVATVTAAARDRVIDGMLETLDRAYVFPAKAVEMRKAITERRENGEYMSATDASEFAALLTRHLQDVSHDLHLRVAYGSIAGRAPSELAVGAISGAEILEGNIGYVEVASFAYSARAIADVVAKQMTVVADADALIIDIRRNRGGAPEAVSLVASYLFSEEPVHLTSIYFRPDNSTDESYTFRMVAGKRFGPDKPVYVLTSKTTFSAGEEFAYDLQSQKRVTVVGETSGGGAHPGGPQPLTDGFLVWVPVGRAINPITGTNWEGVGVRPDVAVPADSALKAALILARARKK